MIAYLQDKDVSVEVPDDISEKDLVDLQKNFNSYFPEENSTTPKTQESTSSAPVDPNAIAPAEPKKTFSRNFFEGYLKSVIPSLGVADSTRWAIGTPEGRAFSGKALDSFTFGLTKPLTEPFLKEEYKNHPVYDAAGEIAGGVGSLLATGGLLRLAGLSVKAAQVGQAATQIGAEIPAIAKITASAPRFLTPAIMTGSTFGTNTFIKKTVEAFQKGGVDIVDFGKSVIKDTALGAAFGGISGLSNIPTAVSSAYGLGYLSARADGADNVESHLNAAVWATFELIGSFGKDARLKAEALNRLGGSFGEYVKAKNPNIPKAEADAIGQAFVRHEAEKVGGMESIIKGDRKDALQLIENINQRVNGAKVEVKPEAPLQIENSRPEAVKTAESAGLSPVEPARPVSVPGQELQPTVQAPLVNQGTSPASEALPSNVFPPTEVSSNPIISEHPNFKQLTDDANFIVSKYAMERGVEPTKDLAISLYRELHDTLGEIMRAPPEKRVEIAAQIKAEHPNIEKEFSVLKDKIYTDDAEKYFQVNIANNYTPIKRNVPQGTNQPIEPKIISTPENQQVNITQEMIHDEALSLQQQARENADAPNELAQFVSSNGGVKSFGRDSAGNVVESEEFKDIPIRFKRKNGLYADELAQMWSDAHPQDQITADDLRNRLKEIAKKQKVLGIEQYYPQAQRNLEELFSGQPPQTEEDKTFADLEDYFGQMAQGASENKPVSYGDKTNTPEFKKWFGESKVVDGSGKPLVVYHQTNADFNSFKPISAQWGNAYFFLSDNRAGGKRARTVQAYLSLKNPLIADDLTDSQAVEQARKNGNDGVILNHGDRQEYIVFDSTQIKSATGNEGAFDANNPNILKESNQNIGDNFDSPYKQEPSITPSETVRGGFKAIKTPHLEVEYKETGAIVIPNREIDSPADLAFAFKNLTNEAQENFYLGVIKNKRIVAVEHIGFGTIDQVAVYPFETLNLPDKTEADEFFLVHNHPSGEIVPSEEDKNLTRRLRESLIKNGVVFAGHVIIDDTKFGFIDPDGNITENSHSEIKDTKELPILKKYFEWKRSKAEIKEGPTINGPTKAFELFKGIQTSKDEGIVYLLDIQNRLLNAVILPKDKFTSGVIQRLASAYRVPSIITLNSGMDARQYNSFKNDLYRTDIRVLDDVEVKGDTFQSKREMFGEFKIKYQTRASEQGALFNTEGENIGDRYNRLRKQAIDQGMNPAQASKWAKENLRNPSPETKTEKPVQSEFTAGGVQSFGKGSKGESDLFFDKIFPSSKGGTENRQFGDMGDQISALKNSLGGLEYIKKIEGPELVELAKMISGNVPVIKKLTRSLGYFKPNGERIVLTPELFKDQKLWEAVLAHEIGHLMDFNPEKTMNRGNILGRIASLKDYLKSLLPESPDSKEEILTSKDRAKFRKMAEDIAKGGSAKNEPDAKFDPQVILNVWNAVTSDATPDLMDYIKGLNAEDKKALIKSAMQALKKGEKVTVYDINKFNKDAQKNLKSVSDIYRNIVKDEIKKRKLWENEVIRDELKNLTQYWKPFNDKANTGFTTYRYSSPELYADFISVLFNAPAKALQIAPNAYNAFFNYLENKPEVMQSIIEIQAMTQSDDMDLQRIRGERILEMFNRAEQAFRSRAINTEMSKKTTWDKLRVYFWDKNAIILDQNDKLRKEIKLAPSDDAQYAIEKNSMLAVFVKSYLDDFDRLVYDPAKQQDLLNDVKVVLFLDRVGSDRAEMANPLGHTPKSTQDYLSFMEKQDPEKFKKVNDLATQAREWFKQISSIPGASDFFTPEQLFTIGLNDKYAPFRVVDYMSDYVSAGFSNQMGTFKDIGDPLTSIAMKGASVLTAIERNRLKKIIGEMLLKSGTPMRPAEIIQMPGNFRIKDPTEPYLGTFAWKSEGKWQAYHVDKYIADVFNTSTTNKIGEIGAAFNALFQNNIFRGMWITFSPSFQAVNLIRDMLRTWKVTPGLTFPQLLKSYVQSIPEAKARAAGLYNPLIQQMERSGAMQLSLNDLILGQTSEDKELETFLQKYDIVESPESKYKNIPIINQITQAMDYLRYVGDTIESLPKIAGWKALDYMDDEERSYFVRNFVGTPNFRRAGLASPVTNSILMFSNIFKEGYRGLIETALTNEKTRKDYWTKTFISTFLPKIAMALAGAGFFGIGVKRVMDKASEYHKTNYVVIPIGVDASGNGVYLTIPQDEDARLIGGLFWKSLHTGKGLENNLSDILAFGAGQFPGVAPLVDISKAWVTFLSGKNPEDSFRGQKILTDQERSAGGMYAFEPMARWTLNETGLFKLDIRDRLKDEPIYKPIIASIPVLQRFLKISRQGEREMARIAAQKAQKEEARKSIDIKESAMNAIREGKSIQEFSGNAKTLEEARKMRDVYNRQMKGFTNDPYIQALNSAASKDQKLEILKVVKSTYQNKEDFNDYLNTLYLNKIITARVVLEARD